VRDKTGKEDLVASLRSALLLRRAAELGCNKVRGCPVRLLYGHCGVRSQLSIQQGSLRTARQARCMQVALGCSATHLAAHIVAAMSKGSGYALPGDLQFHDARWVLLHLLVSKPAQSCEWDRNVARMLMQARRWAAGRGAASQGCRRTGPGAGVPL
jgi:hypothetical protein